MTIAARSVGILVTLRPVARSWSVLAQESKSAPLAAQLCKLLDENKLDSIAARES